MTQPQPRDKRRFYVKKLAISIDRFKEWEEQLGDSWYRHHNKVNNIVYYHCKHEPCYASMKAKVMVDFVQLYVTEEGHTHPPFANNVAALSELASSQTSTEFTNSEYKSSQMNAERNASQPPKRQRIGEEQPSKGIPLIYQQQLLQLLQLQGDPIAESVMTDNRRIYPGGFHVDSFLVSTDQTKQNSQTQHKTESKWTPSNMDGQTEESFGDEANSTESKPSATLLSICDQNQSTTEMGGELTIEHTIISNQCEPISSTSLANSSQPQTSGVARCVEPNLRCPQTDAKESDNDEDSSDCEHSTEDSLSSSTPISLKVEEINHLSTTANGNESEEIFAMIKSRVESKSPHKRLTFLRKLKRQLSYFVEMEEVRALTARLPANAKFDDVFHSLKL